MSNSNTLHQPVAVCWEYQALPMDRPQHPDLRDLGALNEAGAAGWELCHVGQQHYLMKRQIYQQRTQATD